MYEPLLLEQGDVFLIEFDVGSSLVDEIVIILIQQIEVAVQFVHN